MAVAIYTSDLTILIPDDVASTWNRAALWGWASGLNIETDYFIQGVNCMSKNAFASSTKGMVEDTTATLLTTGDLKAVYTWITHTTPWSLDTKANGWIRVSMWSSSAALNEYYYAWSDTIDYWAPWICAVVDPENATASTGTVLHTAIDTYWGQAKLVWWPTKWAPLWIDAIRQGRTYSVTAGDITTPATFVWASAKNDLQANRYGQFQWVPWISWSYTMQCHFEIGTVATAWYFLDENFSISLNDLEFVSPDFILFEVVNAWTTCIWKNWTISAVWTNVKWNFLATSSLLIQHTWMTFNDMWTFDYDSNSTIDWTKFVRTDLITQNSATITNSTISETSNGWWGGTLLTDLISYYKFDNDVLDAHWSNDWTDNWTSDIAWIINRGRDFDWINDDINLNYAPSWANTTLWFWYKHTTTWTDEYIISQYWDWTLSWRWGIQTKTDNTLFVFQNPWNIINITSSALTVWNWYYIQVKRTATDLWELFVNWTSQWADTWWLALSADNLELMKLTTIYAVWIIDKLWCWDKVTSTDEDTELYNSWAWKSYDTFAGNNKALLSNNPALISDTSFISSWTGHWIEITTAWTYTFTWNTFTGYAWTDWSTGNEAIYNNSWWAVTLNIEWWWDTPTIRNGASATTTVNNTKTFKFTLDPSIIWYEWRLYSVTAKWSLVWSVELVWEESASVDNQTYSYSYTVDTPIAVQIISQPDHDYEEKIHYDTLTNSSKNLTITLIPDTNN